MTQTNPAAKPFAPVLAETDLHTWAAEGDAVVDTLAVRLERAEPRQRVLRYRTGLLRLAERNNGWQLAEWAGAALPAGGMQRLLSTAYSEADPMRDDRVGDVLEQLADPAAVRRRRAR